MLLQEIAQNEFEAFALIYGLAALIVVLILSGIAVYFLSRNKFGVAFYFIFFAVIIAISIGVAISKQYEIYRESGAEIWQDYAAYQAGELSQEEWQDKYNVGPWQPN